MDRGKRMARRVSNVYILHNFFFFNIRETYCLNRSGGQNRISCILLFCVFGGFLCFNCLMGLMVIDGGLMGG